MSYAVSETTTQGLARDVGPELWREHVRANHGTLGCAFEDRGGFAGSTVVQRAGEHQLVEFWSDAIVYERTERDAREDGVTRVVVPRRGDVLVRGGRTTTRVAPGAAVALPRGAGFRVGHGTDARAWILTVPSALRRRDEPAVLDLRSGTGAIARTLLSAMSEQRRALGAADFVGLADQVAALLRTGEVAQDDLTRAARDVARRRAGDRTLTPASLAHELGWSLRRLQGSLREAGTTPAEVIREARLEAAWTALRAGGGVPASASVAEIAFACGFGSLSAFNDAFRRRYGMSPRQARADGAAAG